jgi:hypothetical protein
MEKFKIEKDIKVFCMTAKSFPHGVGAAHQQLRALLPHTEGRQFYGISYSNKEGGIIYKAAVAESIEGEAEQYDCEIFIIKKGIYLRETLIDWQKDETIVGKTFQKLLANPELDPNGYCLEVYLDEKDMQCMVPLMSKNIS